MHLLSIRVNLKTTMTAAVVLAGLAGTTAATAQQQFVTIGTGGVTGVYYPAGGAVCVNVNRSRGDHGIRCSAEATGGSVFNLNSIRSGELDVGVVQSDVQYFALEGVEQFADAGPYEDLRALFSLHPEPYTVLARPDADISSFGDLRGKRVNIGNPGSGIRATTELLMEAYGWTADDFALASELDLVETGQALCDNRLDAIALVVGHPAAVVSEAVATCGAVLIEVSGETIDAIVDDTTYFTMATIPAGMYNNEADVTTFGVGATVVSSTNTSDEVVYEVVRAVFEHLDDFKALHPAFQILEAETMVSEGNSAPLHDGAVRYYEEAGLL